jgi:hypothetical protein
LWVPSRAYLSLCDRLGLLVWLELPLWLPQMTRRRLPTRRASTPRLCAKCAITRRLCCGRWGCELSARFPSDALGELYALVKRLTGSPLVRDNSGGGECYGGALQEYADFADYHLYGDAHFARATFRAFLDTPRAPAPWLQGEFADHDTLRDFPTLRRSVPAEQLWWLSPDPAVNPQGVRWFYETPFVEARLHEAGLTDAIPDLVRASRREMVAYHKLVLETMRRLPGTSGYVVTGLKDTPISTAGILDERGELKIAPDEYAAFNADTVLLVDWHRRRGWIAGATARRTPTRTTTSRGAQSTRACRLPMRARRWRGRFCAGGWRPNRAQRKQARRTSGASRRASRSLRRRRCACPTRRRRPACDSSPN